MTGNATALSPEPTYIAGDGAARKLVVLRVVLERLVDTIEDAGRLARGNVELRNKLDDAIELASVALDEVTPLMCRP